MSTSDLPRWRPRLTHLGRRISRKNRILIAIVAASLLAATTLMATGPKPETKTADEKAWPVSAMEINPQRISPELHLFGRVESPHHASLSSAITAEVLKVHVQEGQTVSRGELLVSLDATEEQLRLQQAEATLQDAEAQLGGVKTDFVADQQVLKHMKNLYALTSAKAERLKGLTQKQLIATEQMENTLQEVARQGIELARQQARVDKHPQRLASAESTVERANVALDKQRLNLARTRITAPFKGRVSALVASPGDRVGTGSTLLSIYDTNALQVRVALPTSSLPEIKQALAQGYRITARTDQSDSNAAILELVELAGEINRGRSGVDGLFSLSQGGVDLELGRALELRLTLPPVDNVVALPAQSLYNSKRIFIIRDQRLHGVDVVTLGQRVRASGELEVLIDASHLAPNSLVLTSSLPRAITGLRVQTIDSTIATRSAEDNATHTQAAAPVSQPG